MTEISLPLRPKDPNGLIKLPNGVTEFVITNPVGFPTVDAWNFTIQASAWQDDVR